MWWVVEKGVRLAECNCVCDLLVGGRPGHVVRVVEELYAGDGGGSGAAAVSSIHLSTSAFEYPSICAAIANDAALTHT